ncbi:hypothetical protein GCM10028832_10990 [Streptomyces sparsus]
MRDVAVAGEEAGPDPLPAGRMPALRVRRTVCAAIRGEQKASRRSPPRRGPRPGGDIPPINLSHATARAVEWVNT